MKKIAMALAVFSCVPAAMAEYPSHLFSGLEYRMVGPSRGGRVTAVAGHRAHPSTFYMGTVGGGRLEDRGQWDPLASHLRWLLCHGLDRRDPRCGFEP